MEFLYTSKEVIELLRISRTTLNKLMQNREIPFRKIGGQNRFIKKEIEEYINKKGNRK